MLNQLAKYSFSLNQSLPKLKVFTEVQKLPLKKLSLQDANQLLKQTGLEDWSVAAEGDKIKKDLKFQDFIQALSFMNSIGFLAEEMCHHPDWFNVYNNVKINLNTHDCKGISMKDIVMAFAIVNC